MRIESGWIWFAAAMVALLWLAPAAVAHDKNKRPAFTLGELEPLLQALQDEGVPRPVLNRIFYDDRLRKIDSVVTLNGHNPESPDRYRQFYTPYAIRKAKRFKRRHFNSLAQVEQELGIPMNVIVGILLVETQFGTYPLSYRVLEVFTTLVVEANHDAIDRHFHRVKQTYPEIDRGYFAQRVSSKAEWAYNELIALLSMERSGPGALYNLKGSYAGAFGMPQFLPSSYLRWAIDGNLDGEVNLDHTIDAVYSIANYLKEHGWVRDAAYHDRMRAVWSYNNSIDYVDAIFEISRRMMLPPRKARRPKPVISPSPYKMMG